jgi:hypothetical protein
MWFWPVNRMALRPGLLWLTLIWPILFSVFTNFFFFNFTCPVRCFRVPPGLWIQVEHHCYKALPYDSRSSRAVRWSQFFLQVFLEIKEPYLEPVQSTSSYHASLPPILILSSHIGLSLHTYHISFRFTDYVGVRISCLPTWSTRLPFHFPWYELN